jgi:hypothetical protein
VNVIDCRIVIVADAGTCAQSRAPAPAIAHSRNSARNRGRISFIVRQIGEPAGRQNVTTVAT